MSVVMDDAQESSAATFSPQTPIIKISSDTITIDHAGYYYVEAFGANGGLGGAAGNDPDSAFRAAGGI
ncbi:MAG: hypothetical protein LBR42_04400, partial [Candidatus Methanoplasma sp.]|nr:hypothetical protein [Candidatus Methanoplasma sp.]